jgi:hypothetical protein
MDMDRSARGWLFNTASANYWRVAGWYEFDDLLQDGYLHWQRVCLRYSLFANRMQHARHRRHIMRLFQTTYMNHLNDLANRKSREPEMVPLRPDIQDAHGGRTEEQECCAYAELLQLCAEAPWPMNKVLMILVTDASNDALAARYRFRTDGTRETFNERLCRIANVNPIGFDLPAMIREYLSTV